MPQPRGRFRQDLDARMIIPKRHVEYSYEALTNHIQRRLQTALVGCYTIYVFKKQSWNCRGLAHSASSAKQTEPGPHFLRPKTLVCTVVRANRVTADTVSVRQIVALANHLGKSAGFQHILFVGTTGKRPPSSVKRPPVPRQVLVLSAETFRKRWNTR
jgi:hypothetical protein